MVHALESIHHLLTPAGRLIDIHPFAEAPMIEVHQGGRRTFSEPVPAYAVEDIQHAEQALAHTVENGFFAVERARAFQFRTYAFSVAELTGFLAEQGSFAGGPPGEDVAAQAAQYEEMAAHVEQLMQAAGEGTEVVLHERAHIIMLAALARVPR